MRLTLTLEDGSSLQPLALPDTVRRFRQDGATRVEFNRLAWQRADGTMVPELLLTLQHEFFADGTAFTTAFFAAEGHNAPAIKQMVLGIQLDCSSFDSLRWGLLGRPQQADGAMIMAPSERFLPPGTERSFATGLFPMAGFYLRRREGPSLYAEFFMEGNNTLSNDPADNASSITWHEGAPLLRWVIQKRAFKRPYLYQWRNQWGWVIRPAAAVRHKPPLQIYQYFDNYRRYPEPEQIEALAAAGCDLLIMHENWRIDAQNDGIPYDLAALTALKRELRRRQIRLALYVRGNEESIMARGGAWFDRLLERNYDGLYVDYGGPLHEIAPPDESYNGGRLLFRRHYLRWRELRRRVGPEGLLYSHTGPSFSALGLPFVDGYVSGEGERGALVRSREEHEYYSMAAVTPGTMWVAAFPEYTSALMVPFLAATGQYPHSPLGEQFLTSSLVHPPEPGINDQAFQTLWRIWSVVRQEHNLRVYHNYNTTGLFPAEPATGHYLMVAEQERLALLVVSNFASEPGSAQLGHIAWPFQLAGRQLYLLGERAEALTGLPQEITLSGYGVAGVLFAGQEADVAQLLAAYSRPAAGRYRLGEAYLAEIEQQRRWRETPPQWRETWLTVSVPPVPAATYEDSLLVDLYYNTILLEEIMPDGTMREVTWIDRRGAVATSDPAQRLDAGDTAPAINLATLLGAGRHRLALRSFHYDEPFYSFCYATLAPDAIATGPEALRIAFHSELEPDRSRLTFTVEIK